MTGAEKLSIAYFAQHELDEDAYDHVRKLMGDAPEAKVRARAGAIGFSGKAADRLWIVADRTVTNYDGDLDEYAACCRPRATASPLRASAARQARKRSARDRTIVAR